MQMGICPYGDKCSFAHGVGELRQAQPVQQQLQIPPSNQYPFVVAGAQQPSAMPLQPAISAPPFSAGPNYFTPPSQQFYPGAGNARQLSA
jgi:hypothetical protein